MDYKIIVSKIRSNFSTKGKNAIYDYRVNNPPTSIKYSNKDEENINNTGD